MRVDVCDIALRDERGWIRNIGPTTAVIFSKAGTVRSNHYHKSGWHWLYVLSGKMLYLEKIGQTTVRKTIEPGERVWTGPMVPHRTEFLEDTMLISMGPTSNDTDHEKDLVRVEWTE